MRTSELGVNEQPGIAKQKGLSQIQKQFNLPFPIIKIRIRVTN